jgi:predicted dinucleotide-utilizing enzyme
MFEEYDVIVITINEGLSRASLESTVASPMAISEIVKSVLIQGKEMIVHCLSDKRRSVQTDFFTPTKLFS